jgi:hypothetical protein|tara:strand:+ start:63 stop:260 length:198 start_codon:yes stop_codon:yes gene_type:complete
MSLPHEPNIQDQERAEVMQNLAQVVGDACEAWLRRRGMGTKSFRDQISDSAKTTVAEKNEKEDSH